MAKQKNSTERYAVNKKLSKKEREAAARREQEEQQRRAENAQKSARMGSAFLYGFLALITVFFLYLLIRTLFFPSASVTELRSNLLFLSLAGIPYLVAAAAVVIRRLNRKRRIEYSDRGRRLATALYLIVLLGCFAVFGIQMGSGRQDGADSPVYTAVREALGQSGLTVTEPEEVPAFRSMLEYSLETELGCGQSKLLLNYHSAGTGMIPARFLVQAAHDYRDCPLTEEDGLRIWGPKETDGSARAALALRQGRQVWVLELQGPRAELEQLIPLLKHTIPGE